MSPVAKRSVRRNIPPRDLRAIWEKIPSIKCAGKCEASCSAIECSSLEKGLIEDRAGRPLNAKTRDATCSMLRNGRCSVYSVRPVICRLWGVVESMPCPHGCKPERVLGDREGIGLVVEAMVLAGDDPEEVHRRFMEECPQEILDAMKAWTLGAPDLGGVLVNRPKAEAEFKAALDRHGFASSGLRGRTR
jgi:hypothetical protein